ncbi:MAG TPA: glucuronate isomerase [Ohtaekwangia sp.]|nr:glucuronate isomerase [Ohtaekwangia sp.]
MINTTIREFITPDFLLETESAKVLYDQFAAPMPIIDYHNHLSPKDISENRQFNNLTEIWLDGDHYKWRAMRTNGIPERYCTGNASPEEKFQKWAETVPYALRNPLYHWTHLELKNYFGITTLLDGKSALKIYTEANEKLKNEDYFTRGLLNKMNVKVLCTTDDPTDTLEYHQQFAKQEAGFKMYPTFRPDKVYGVEDPVVYAAYLEKLSAVTRIEIKNFDDLLQALENRINFFTEQGCRASDHGLEQLYFFADAEIVADNLFQKIKGGKSLDTTERNQFKCAVLINLGRMYHAKSWAQQFHVGALRNNNSRMLRELGPDTGFDSVGDFSQARSMSQFFNHLDNTNQLAKTIVYNLNPADNELIATMIGNFNDGSVAGKMQFGSGWWFLDQKDGMEKQMNALSNMGLLSRFVGMVTDSRSFLSFPRHEYFRRVLCNMLGNDIEKGELPSDIEGIGGMVEAICFKNADQYFGFNAGS